MQESQAQPPALGADQLEFLRRSGRQQSYPAGATIFSEGDRPEFAVLIERGLVKLTSETEAGRTSVLTLRGAGDLIGEFGCVDGSPRSASVITLTPVIASLIPSSRFRKALESRTDILLTLLRVAIARVRESDRRRVEFGYSAIDRVGKVLFELAQRHGEAVDGDQRSVRLRTTQQDLADAAIVSRKTVTRVLRDLAESGVISTIPGQVVIHDLDQLRRQI